ncbi:MAG: response regulator transcription factor [Ignavibacteriae bacterium]|nr:response regulator transcription factor [Ignavibacteriota bacterium]
MHESLNKSVNVFLADDHTLMRQGLASLIEKDVSMKVIGQAENGKEAVEKCLLLRPDIILMDISMPELNGIEATRQIIHAIPDAKVIALSMHIDKRYVTGMLSAGAKGYMLKHCAATELGTAIEAVLRGKVYLSPEITGVVVEDIVIHAQQSNEHKSVSLTAKAREVLQLLAEGNSGREIAEKLNLSIHTIDSHKKNIMDKLQMFSVAELTKYAVREGLTGLE